MDLHSIFSQALQQGLGPAAAVYCLAAIGLNVHFGYTGLLNFGQAGFMAVAATPWRRSSPPGACPFWLGIAVGLLARSCSRCCSGCRRCGCARTTWRSSRSPPRRSSDRRSGRSRLLKYFGGQDGLQSFNQTFADLNPFTSPMSIPGVVSWRPYDFWVLVVGWTLVALSCLLVWALMRSPWGRVLKGIREDEDAVRSLGKNVYAYKMQSLVIGGLFGALAGFMSACSTRRSTRRSSPPTPRSSPTPCCSSVAPPGSSARSPGAIIFWFLHQLPGPVLRRRPPRAPTR